MDTDLLVGIVGSAFILLAFTLNELHVWGEDDFKYDLVNFLGGILLLWYSWALNSWPFVVLNGVWAAVALRDVVLDLRRDKTPQSQADGRAGNDTI